MMDKEKTIEEEWNLFNEAKAKSLINKLKKKRLNGYYAETREDAQKLVLGLISSFSIELEDWEGKIGIADSLSLHQINLFEELYADNKLEIINPFKRLEDGRYSVFEGQPNEWIPKEIYVPLFKKVFDLAREALLSDVFITSANALTWEGEIVSTDGVGNRIAGVIFGPKKVILVIGMNKIVKDRDAAFERIKHISAPMNHIRHYNKHDIQFKRLADLPCVKQGYCVDCNSPNCTRRASIIVHGPVEDLYKDRIHIVLVGEEIGL